MGGKIDALTTLAYKIIDERYKQNHNIGLSPILMHVGYTRIQKMHVKHIQWNSNFALGI